MKVSELLEKTQWQLLTKKSNLDKEINGAYSGDLLSWVMGKGKPMQAWITVQAHRNIIAVASLREFTCIILADGVIASEYLIETADDEGMILIASDRPAFETAKVLVELGI